MENQDLKLNEFMVRVFNDILKIEEEYLCQGEFSNLSVREMHVIEKVLENSQESSPKIVAKSLGITQGSLSTALAALEKKGYLRRETAKEDKRRVIICLSEKGKRANAHHKEFHEKLVEFVKKGLNQEGLNAFLQGLGAISCFFQEENFNLKNRSNNMRTIILTDSTSDIEKDVAKSLDVEVLPLTVIFGEEQFLDGVTISKKEFYEKLETSENLPTTSQINPDAFLKFFEACKKNGDELVYISISSKLSGTFQSATIARDMCEYDGIYLVDSLSATAGEQALVEYAVALRNAGKSAKVIAEMIERDKTKLRLVAAVDTLKYLIKGGRLSKVAGAIGGMLSLKPIISLVDGEVQAIDKARGRQGAFKALLKNFEENDFNPDMPVILTQSCDPNSINELASFMEENGHKLSYSSAEVGCVIGTYAGPRCLGLIYFVK